MSFFIRQGRSMFGILSYAPSVSKACLALGSLEREMSEGAKKGSAREVVRCERLVMRREKPHMYAGTAC